MSITTASGNSGNGQENQDQGPGTTLATSSGQGDGKSLSKSAVATTKNDTTGDASSGVKNVASVGETAVAGKEKPQLTREHDFDAAAKDIEVRRLRTVETVVFTDGYATAKQNSDGTLDYNSIKIFSTRQEAVDDTAANHTVQVNGRTPVSTATNTANIVFIYGGATVPHRVMTPHGEIYMNGMQYTELTILHEQAHSRGIGNEPGHDRDADIEALKELGIY